MLSSGGGWLVLGEPEVDWAEVDTPEVPPPVAEVLVGVVPDVLPVCEEREFEGVDIVHRSPKGVVGDEVGVGPAGWERLVGSQEGQDGGLTEGLVKDV